jgi:LemA protein
LSSSLYRVYWVVSENYSLQANQGFQILLRRHQYIWCLAVHTVGPGYNVQTASKNLHGHGFGYQVKPAFTVQNEAQISQPPAVSFEEITVEYAASLQLREH